MSAPFNMLNTRTEADSIASWRDAPTRYVEAALTVVEQGWASVPLHPATKIPSRRKWQLRVGLSSADLRREVERELRWRGDADRRASAVGIVVPPSVLAIDCDLLIGGEAIWQAMLETFGAPDMVRVGQPPKFMGFYGAEPGVR